MFKKLDLYIIKKFLGTYFFSILLIISIAIVFDLSEHIGDFIEKDAPLKKIVFNYYLPFIPYFANLFSALFIFISVIFFTSKMAYSSEIIAIISSGISFHRFLLPFMTTAAFLAVFNFTLNAFIIPPGNKYRLEFENKYIRNKYRNFDRDIHKQLKKNLYVYIENYNVENEMGYKFALEKFKDNKLISKLNADYINWDSTKNAWTVNNYRIREIDSISETLTKGRRLDTVLSMHPKDFQRRKSFKETMTLSQLNKYIEEQELQGSSTVVELWVYRYKKYISPLSTFILTLIGVSLASRKIKGGIGIHIGLGLLLSFTYIFFMQFSTNFAIGGNMNPLLAVMTPSLIFLFIGIVLYRTAPK